MQKTQQRASSDKPTSSTLPEKITWVQLDPIHLKDRLRMAEEVHALLQRAKSVRPQTLHSTVNV